MSGKDGAAAAPKLSFGFKKAVPAIGTGFAVKPTTSKSSASAPSTRRAAFGDDEASDHDDAIPIASMSKTKGSTATKKSNQPIGFGAGGKAPPSKAAAARQAEALQLDSSVFDYDGVYDAMKSSDTAAKKRREEEAKKRDPKYAEAFAKSAEQRKADFVRAEAKKIAREREAEGAEFEGTEAFVTDAYKQQMEEIALAEERERKEEEKNRANSKGLPSFQRDLLARRAAEHDAAVAASLAAAAAKAALPDAQEVEAVDEDNNSKQRSHKVLVEEARAKGLDVRLNDDGEIIDERSILAAGLNRMKKPSASSSTVAASGSSALSSREAGQPRDGAREARAARDAQRARQSKMMEEQMLELTQKRQREEEEEAREAKRRAMGGEKRNDDTAVSSAKERFLERKRKKEEEERRKTDAEAEGK